MTNCKQHIFFGAAAVVMMVLEIHGLSMAVDSGYSAGSNLVSTFTDTITGNIGLFIGLLLTLWGLWTWIVKQDTGAGVTMIAGGVALTLLPNIFNGMRGVVDGVVTQFGSDTATSGGIKATTSLRPTN
jgi:hypothetical protein